MEEGLHLNRKLLSAIVLLSIILVLVASQVALEPVKKTSSFPAGFYAGVTANGNVTETERLIDRTMGFTNFVVIYNRDTMKNKTMLDEVSDYTYKAGLSFFVYMEDPMRGGFNYDPIGWAAEAKEKYGNSFLGYYLYDEPGGNQLDCGNFRQFDTQRDTPSTYHNAANEYCYYLFCMMRNFMKTDKLVTSDYGLYWYDYEAGYDTIFCEFGWNNSRTTNIALCRGAAEIHSRDWGVMITWTYSKPPYLESGSALYGDMVTAYEAGAKYVVVFNYPQIGPYGALTEEHFDAMKEFKDFVSTKTETNSSDTKRVAYVVPADYGWGFRREEDTIWGIWSADGNATKIWNDIKNYTQTYGDDFDTIYNNPLTFFTWKSHYSKLIRWDG